MKPEVRHGASDIEEIERFRYAVYIAEQGKPLPWADHVSRRLSDADDSSAFHFCVRDAAGQIIAYSRMHYALSVPQNIIRRLSLEELFSHSAHKIGFISKLMVDSQSRGRTSAVRLIEEMILYGCHRFPDAEAAVFHCSLSLVPLYARLGFRTFGDPFQDAYVGLQVPMVAIFRDSAHYQACRSPLRAVAERVDRSPEKLDRVQDYFLSKRAVPAILVEPCHDTT